MSALLVVIYLVLAFVLVVWLSDVLTSVEDEGSEYVEHRVTEILKTQGKEAAQKFADNNPCKDSEKIKSKLLK